MTGKKGIFITLEGPEGSGKSTQSVLLKKYFEGRGTDCVMTREPGGTPLAETLRGILKNKSAEEELRPQTELMLFIACRAQLCANVIKPALARGAAVVCDRFHDSTLAYQGYARGMDLAFVKSLNDFALDGCLPDFTFVLDIDPASGFGRIAGRDLSASKNDRFETEPESFHRKVRDAFLTIARDNPRRVRVIDAARPPETVHRDIIKAIENEP